MKPYNELGRLGKFLVRRGVGREYWNSHTENAEVREQIRQYDSKKSLDLSVRCSSKS